MKTYKPQPKTVTFEYLLRRRGLTFETWARAAGVSSYSGLVAWCDGIGAIPPSEDVWRTYMPVAVNAPPDGIVVVNVEPIPLTVDSSSPALTKPKKNKAPESKDPSAV
jgi:hypothetical protein